MKLFGDDGYLRPKVQVVLGVILAVHFSLNGINLLLSKSVVGVCTPHATPGWGRLVPGL